LVFAIDLIRAKTVWLGIRVTDGCRTACAPVDCCPIIIFSNFTYILYYKSYRSDNVQTM